MYLLKSGESTSLSASTFRMKRKHKSLWSTFWGKLLAEGETKTISSKRLCMLVSLFVLIILAILSAFGFNCTEVYVYVFASLVGLESGFTTFEKSRSHYRPNAIKDNSTDNEEEETS